MGSEVKEICAGRALVFDDSFEHEAWNDEIISGRSAGALIDEAPGAVVEVASRTDSDSCKHDRWGQLRSERGARWSYRDRPLESQHHLDNGSCAGEVRSCSRDGGNGSGIQSGGTVPKSASHQRGQYCREAVAPRGESNDAEIDTVHDIGCGDQLRHGEEVLLEQTTVSPGPRVNLIADVWHPDLTHGYESHIIFCGSIGTFRCDENDTLSIHHSIGAEVA